MRVCFLGIKEREKKKASNWESERETKMRWYKENGRKAAHTNTRSFKPQKLFRATNSFYKANCALIPVISKTEGRKAGWGGGRGKHLSLKMNCSYCQMFSLSTHMHPHSSTPCTHLQVEQWWLPKNMQTKEHKTSCTLAHTFPRGNESCQQLTEVSPGVWILISRWESFQLRGRAAVSEVGLSQAVDASLNKESYSIMTKT